MSTRSKDLLIREKELDAFNELMFSVPYGYAKPIEQFFAQVRANRATEEQQMQKAFEADQLRQLEEEKLKEQKMSAPDSNLKIAKTATQEESEEVLQN